MNLMAAFNSYNVAIAKQDKPKLTLDSLGEYGFGLGFRPSDRAAKTSGSLSQKRRGREESLAARR